MQGLFEFFQNRSWFFKVFFICTHQNLKQSAEYSLDLPEWNIKLNSQGENEVFFVRDPFSKND